MFINNNVIEMKSSWSWKSCLYVVLFLSMVECKEFFWKYKDFLDIGNNNWKSLLKMFIMLVMCCRFLISKD